AGGSGGGQRTFPGGGSAPHPQHLGPGDRGSCIGGGSFPKRRLCLHRVGLQHPPHGSGKGPPGPGASGGTGGQRPSAEPFPGDDPGGSPGGSPAPGGGCEGTGAGDEEAEVTYAARDPGPVRRGGPKGPAAKPF